MKSAINMASDFFEIVDGFEEKPEAEQASQKICDGDEHGKNVCTPVFIQAPCQLEKVFIYY